MRKLAVKILVILLLSGVVLYAANNVYFSYCSKPVTFSVGNIDPRYDMSNTEFKEILLESAQIWNKHYKENLITYDPQSSLKVNLVYDQRTEIFEKIDKGGQTISQRKQALEAEYKKYEQRKADLENKIQQLNSEIEKLVKENGVSKEVYENLKKRQKQLENEITELNGAASAINSETGQINSIIESLNKNVDMFNSMLTERPEEGIYDPLQHKIDIFFFKDRDELLHTATHELGHARGIDHVEGDTSLMNGTVNESTELSDEDLSALEEYCRPRNTFDFLSDYKQKLNGFNISQILDMF